MTGAPRLSTSAGTDDSELNGSVGTGSRKRRIRLGLECGDVFADNEVFDGLTLTLEVASMSEGLALLAQLRAGAPQPPLVQAVAGLTQAERVVFEDALFEDALIEARRVLLIRSESPAAPLADRRAAAGRADVLRTVLLAVSAARHAAEAGAGA